MIMTKARSYDDISVKILNYLFSPQILKRSKTLRFLFFSDMGLSLF